METAGTDTDGRRRDPRRAVRDGDGYGERIDDGFALSALAGDDPADGCGREPGARPPTGMSALDDFTGWTDADCAWRHYWDHANATKGRGWHSDPWVWALTFEIAKKEDERCRPPGS